LKVEGLPHTCFLIPEPHLKSLFGRQQEIITIIPSEAQIALEQGFW
jgi:hypothetical protein